MDFSEAFKSYSQVLGSGHIVHMRHGKAAGMCMFEVCLKCLESMGSGHYGSVVWEI